MRLRRPLTVLATVAALLLGSCDGGPTGPNVGTLAITVSGLPAGAAAAINVSNADGFSQLVTATTTLEAIPAGTYVVSLDIVDADGDLFVGALPEEVRVRRGRTVSFAATYALGSGAIAFTASGVPEGATAQATLTGPGGIARPALIPGTTRGLIPGSWTISNPVAVDDGHIWSAGPQQLQVVTASTTPITIPLTFALASGVLDVTFSGLPEGKAPRALLYSPTNAVDTLTTNITLRGRIPGVHRIFPTAVLDADIRYVAPIAFDTIVPSLTPVAAPIAYVPVTGRLAFFTTGVPDGSSAQARVIGTALDTIVSVADTLKGLPVGTYSVQGVAFVNGSVTYGSGAAADIPVEGALTATAALTFAEDGTFNTMIASAYLVQTAQRMDGTVPLVAGRPALLRIFGTASATNPFTPTVYARIRSGGTTLWEATIDGPVDGVPIIANEASRARSWEALVPGAALQPGVVLELTLDPDVTLAEADRTDNVLVVDPLDVRTLPPFPGRFVPIRFASVTEAADVSVNNGEFFLEGTRDMLPVQAIDWDVRAPYVTNLAPFQTSSGDAWVQLIGELATARSLDGSSRYYMGIVAVGYNSGIAGIAYRPGTTSLTWAKLPSGSNVLAHELGHNLGRPHSPCGGPAGVDLNYPYPDADIGVYGYHLRFDAVIPPTAKDIMSYCSEEWISDYTYERMFQHREINGSVVSTTEREEDVLLVRGSIRNGAVTIDPVFAVRARASVPNGGPNSLELRDASGRSLYRAAFTGMAIEHVGDGTDEHFLFTIPRAALGATELAAVRVTARGMSSELRAPTTPALRLEGRASAVRRSNGSLQISWSDPAARALIVRDAATGQVLTIVQGTEAQLPSFSGELEVLASDGLRTTVSRVRPAPQ